MNFNQQERIAIARILIEIINADGKIDSGEIRYFLQLKNTLGISDAELLVAKSTNTLLAISTIKQMTPDKKIAVAIMMNEMIEADFNTDKNEEKLFSLIAVACEFPIPSK